MKVFLNKFCQQKKFQKMQNTPANKRLHFNGRLPSSQFISAKNSIPAHKKKLGNWVSITPKTVLPDMKKSTLIK